MRRSKNENASFFKKEEIKVLIPPSKIVPSRPTGTGGVTTTQTLNTLLHNMYEMVCSNNAQEHHP
jgi:hypothetical protein